MDSKEIYKDWYVLQVKAGRENIVKQILDHSLIPELKILIFSREIIHQKKDWNLRLTVPVFPGYIFIHKKIKPVYNYLRKILHREFFRPVAFNGKPATVAVDEMKLLLSNADDKGLFPLSSGHITGGKIILNRGPLKKLEGKILFINKKKGKAKVRFTLFQREMDISLGIEFMKQYEEIQPYRKYENTDNLSAGFYYCSCV
jgi:transcriptional antiterminator NusG